LRTLALVPARGGSRAIPRKNVREIAGRPLIGWTIAAGLAARSVDRVVVSTDDDDIAAIAAAHGADVPFVRPAELAGDDVADRPVYEHALRELEREGYLPDAVVWLRPTAPCRSVDDIDAVVAMLADGADSVRSVSPVHDHPYWTFRVDDGRLAPFVGGVRLSAYPRRQDLPAAFALNGAVDGLRVAAAGADGPLFAEGSAAYVMPRERGIDIDDELDLAVAERILEARR
jgi:CMP-N,N'-diacetyllegionaminic acid synthase